MALAPYLTQAAGAAALNAIVDLLDGAGSTLKIYGDTKAATADTAVGAQTLLATLTFATPAFGAATTADPTVATAGTITSDSSCDDTDTATWFRAATSGGTTVFDGSVGTATTDLVFGTAAFVAGAVIAVSALTVTLPLHV